MEKETVPTTVDAVPQWKEEPTEQIKNEIKTLSPQPKAIELNDRGLLNPSDSNEEWRMADLMLKSTALPGQFKNIPQVIMAMQFLKSHGFSPSVAIRQVAIINGSLSIWGELPKAVCERTGELEECEEVIFDKDYKIISFENKNLTAEPWGAACSVKRKSKKVVSRAFTIEDANKAGLLAKTGSVWKSYPKRMLQMRARSLALKDAFADVLSGVAINEYDHDRIGFGEAFQAEPGTKPVLSIAEEINREYVGEEKKNQEQEATG